MSYRLTPLKILAIYTIILMVKEFIVSAGIKGDPGLGGLFPFIFMGLTVVILLVDLLVQALFKKRKTVYSIEACLIAAVVIWYYVDIG